MMGDMDDRTKFVEGNEKVKGSVDYRLGGSERSKTFSAKTH